MALTLVRKHMFRYSVQIVLCNGAYAIPKNSFGDGTNAIPLKIAVWNFAEDVP